MAHTEIRTMFGVKQKVMVLDDNDCYSRLWEIKQYGIGRGHEGGIYGQFPEIDWNREEAAVVEQLKAIDAGFSECPEPGFKIKQTIVKVRR